VKQRATEGKTNTKRAPEGLHTCEGSSVLRSRIACGFEYIFVQTLPKTMSYTDVYEQEKMGRKKLNPAEESILLWL
jgi:hypothetical protein